MSYLISDMLAIADEKYMQMSELLELTKDQTRLLAGEDVESLERYIGYKQNIIDRINLLDTRFEELSMHVLSEANVLKLEELKENITINKIMELDVKIKDVLKVMIEIDSKNSDMGKQLLEKLGNNLKYAGKAPVVFKEYQKEMTGAIFINRQG